MSDLRDSQVRLQTIREVAGTVRKKTRRHAFAHIEKMLANETRRLFADSHWGKAAAEKLKTANGRVNRWRLGKTQWGQICAATAKSYRRGRAAFAKAVRKPTPKNLHTWRKDLKQLWYQLRILQSLNPVVLEEIANDAKTLGEILGRSHDLSFLLQHLKDMRGDGALQKEYAELQPLILKRCATLKRNALELGRRFYAEPPKAFAKRIAIFIEEKKT